MTTIDEAVRAALEFCAAPSNHNPMRGKSYQVRTGTGAGYQCWHSNVQMDNGKRARQALALLEPATADERPGQDDDLSGEG